ncbi:MAG: hypothetical protein IRY98_11085, partial [Alicyclobacillaceae bacterium]|nr:hypothetical protein [Alicyclobacillaceae bacterium]
MRAGAKGPKNKLVAAGTAAILAAALCAGDPGRGVAAEPQLEIVVRADRIEAEDLLPSLATGSDGGLVIRLQIRRATAYGLTLTGNQPHTPAGIPWGLRMDSPGPAVLDQLVADATALGLEGIGIQLDRPVPHMVLNHVFLRCDRLAASHVSIPSMKLTTSKGVSNSGTAPILDLRSLSVVNGQGAVDLINGLLSGHQAEDREKAGDLGSQGRQGDSPPRAETSSGQTGTAPGNPEHSPPYPSQPSRQGTTPTPTRSAPASREKGARVTPEEPPRELIVP